MEGLDILCITRIVVEVVGPLLGEELSTKNISLTYLPISDSSLEEKEGDRRDKKFTLYIMSHLTCYLSSITVERDGLWGEVEYYN